MADGSIEFSVELDAKNAEKELQKIKVNILKQEAELRQQTARKTAMEEELERAGAAADRAKADLEALLRRREQLNSRSGDGDLSYADFEMGRKALDTQIKEQEAMVKALDKDFNDAADAVDKMNKKIDQTTDELNAAQELAGELTKNTMGLPEALEESARLSSELDKKFAKLAKRITGLFKRVFFFSVITMGLRSIRSWIIEVIKSNDEASDALGRLKGALLTLVAPLIDTLLPAFVQFVNLLTKAAAIAAQGVALLLGVSLDQAKRSAEALAEEAGALDSTKKSAERAKRALASFDEINKLTFGKDSGSSSSNDDIQPAFDFQGTDSGTLERILQLAELIGTTIAGWKLGQALGLDLMKTIALMGALYASLLFVKAIFDMWQNGVTFDNLLAALLGLAAAAALLYVALGPTAAAIALIVGGLALLAAGFKDAFENGFTLQNTLAIIAGLLATGLGISILTGSWIPLLIAAIASVLLAIVVAFGEGDRLLAGMKLAWQGALDFIKGLLVGDLSQMLLGVNEFFDGIHTMIDAVILALENMFGAFFDWLNNMTGGEVQGLLDALKANVVGKIESIRLTVGQMLDFIKQEFAALTEFLLGVFSADWEMAWTGVKDIFAGIVNAMLTRIENFVNNAINLVNSVINAINSVGSSLGFSGNIGTLSPLKIPRLAEGAVIPPNSSFLAVLGDQKSGTNIETPLNTMVQAFEIALARSGGQNVTIQFTGDLAQLGRVLNPIIKADNARIGAIL